MGGKGGGTKAKPKFKSYAEARKDREKFRKKLVTKMQCCDADTVDTIDANFVDEFEISTLAKMKFSFCCDAVMQMLSIKVAAIVVDEFKSSTSA